MKTLQTVLTLTLLFKLLQDSRTNYYEDYLTRKRTPQEATREPISPKPSKYNTQQIQTFYKSNPYNLIEDLTTGIVTSSSYKPFRFK